VVVLKVCESLAEPLWNAFSLRFREKAHLSDLTLFLTDGDRLRLQLFLLNHQTGDSPQPRFPILGILLEAFDSKITGQAVQHSLFEPGVHRSTVFA
jgi:hypothetical protein